MDIKQAQSCVEKMSPILIESLGLGNWTIRILWKDLDYGCWGQCNANPSTLLADIDIDADQHPSEDDLADTLLHELLHITQADQHLFSDAVDKAIDNVQQREVLESLRLHGEERAIRQLIIFFKNIDLDANKICKMRKLAVDKSKKA